MNFNIHAHPTRFASQFGGLWTDLSNAQEIIAGRLALSDITQEEAILLRFWVANGYVVLKGAVPSEFVDKANDDIDYLYANEIGFAESWESGVVRVVPLESRHRTMPHKLIDAHACCPNIRGAMLTEKVVRFMNVIFNSPALAFQGIYFEYGSEQPIHQDSAYVHVSRPMELAASWLALEDIKPDSGELEYYPGSHRIREFIFDGNGKWLSDDDTQHAAYLKYLEDESVRSGLKKERFAAKKGDVLIWSADLAHGGSPVKNRTTRRSFVAHWCPATTEPGYFSYTRHSGRIKVSEQACYSYSYHGREQDPYVPIKAAKAEKKRFWSGRRA